MKRSWLFLVMIVFCIAGCGGSTVLRQEIPVSTNPTGAKIYANGEMVGTTPASVSLERTRDHILTLTKDNYRQEDVVIKKTYQKEKTYLNAISAGVNSGLFFSDTRMGVGSAMTSISAQEHSGEAFILVPGAVKVTLTPVSGTAVGRAAPNEAESEPTSKASSEEPALNKKEVAKGLMKIGSNVGFSKTKPLGKEVETSSSSKNYTTPDGTKVTEKSSTSVGVGVNPAGLVNSVIDVLFK